MATVKQAMDVESGSPLTANFPQVTKNNGTNYPVMGLAYDAATDETAYWHFKASNYGSGNLTLVLRWYADTASTGSVEWEAGIAAITPDTDTQDVETKAFGTNTFVNDTHLGTTGQRVHTCSITISNLDSLAADDIVWLRITRDANGTNGTDDMAGDAILIDAEVQYSDT